MRLGVAAGGCGPIGLVRGSRGRLGRPPRRGEGVERVRPRRPGSPAPGRRTAGAVRGRPLRQRAPRLAAGELRALGGRLHHHVVARRLAAGAPRRRDGGGHPGRKAFHVALFDAHDLGRDQRDGGGAAERGRAQRHPDTVPLGQLADDEQAELLAVEDVELGRLGEPRVEFRQTLLAHAEAAVFDLDREAAGHQVTRDPDRRVGRGQRGGVLDQLREQVDDVRDRRALERGLGRAGDRDPRIVLHLGRRAAQDVDHPHRVDPAPAGCRTGQDDQALGVAAHSGGQVVQPEQVFQGLGIGRAPFHLVERGQLPVQQRLVAPGQVAEDVADPAPHPGLADRGLDGGLPGRVERLAHLADLVPAQPGRRPGHLLDGHVLTAPQPRHDVRQLLVGQRCRPTALSRAEAADDAAADQGRVTMTDSSRPSRPRPPDSATRSQSVPGGMGVLPDLVFGGVHAAAEVTGRHGLGHRDPLAGRERREGRGIGADRVLESRQARPASPAGRPC